MTSSLASELSDACGARHQARGLHQLGTVEVQGHLTQREEELEGCGTRDLRLREVKKERLKWIEMIEID